LIVLGILVIRIDAKTVIIKKAKFITIGYERRKDMKKDKSKNKTDRISQPRSLQQMILPKIDLTDPLKLQGSDWENHFFFPKKKLFYFYYRKASLLFCAIVCKDENKKYRLLPYKNKEGKDMRNKIKEKRLYDY
jgi:hypothetical protein